MRFLKRILILLIIVSFNHVIAQELSAEQFRNKDLSDEVISTGGNETTFTREEDHPSISDTHHDMEILVHLAEKNGTGEENADPIKFLSPSTDAKYKRGGMIKIQWIGGEPDDEYALDIFNGRFHYRHIGELKNSGTYPWLIPMDVDPGKEYKFKLTNTEDFGDFAFSNTFMIKRKVPIAAWIVPGAIVVAGGVFLLFYDNSEPELSDLPVPIDPE
jgi:hypothetical protein